MGRISLEELLPKVYRNPDDAGPIGSLGLPRSAKLMLAGFNRKAGEPLCFEAEIDVNFRAVEREWRYEESGGTAERSERTWRFEFAVKKGGPIKPGHFLVVAQEPYANRWLEHTPFHQFSHRPEEERGLPVVRADELGPDRDPLAWLDGSVKYDPWETGTRLVAGISHPHGYGGNDPRNAAGDFFLGACPDFDGIAKELMESDKVRDLLRLTEIDKIAYSRFAPQRIPLHADVKEAARELMWISVRQTLAGPRERCREWVGEPVSNWLDLVYQDHLNECNKAAWSREESETKGQRQMHAETSSIRQSGAPSAAASRRR
jgi:hypothetical protein